MLEANEVITLARRLRDDHRIELNEFDETRDFLAGKRGVPSVPAGAAGDVREIAHLSVKNIMPIVVDTFSQALAVDGFRSPSSENDADVWDIWQRERMDARQSEVHRPAIGYGAAYVILAPNDSGRVEWRLRTPRQVIAEYDDPTRDEWPQYALESWTVGSGTRKQVRGVLYDEEYAYPVTIFGDSRSSRMEVGEGTLHGFDVCPVVRFLNDRDAEDKVRGEVQPLIPDQRAINAVNFDRLIVSRFGAFPQKYIMGWAPPEDEEASLPTLSARGILAFDDADVKAGTFPSANVDAYNSILEEMIVHAALKARVNVAALTGNLSNVGAETIALVDAPNQRKIAAKKRSFGESWEQALRKTAEAEGIEVPDDAEVQWRDTEARSFAQVVDGITKLASLEPALLSEMLTEIPGLSQQQVDSMREAIRRGEASSLARSIVDAARRPAPPAEPAAIGA